MDILTDLRENLFLKTYRSKSGVDAENYLRCLCTGRISKIVFLAAYKKLPPIEEMPDHEKKEMKLYIHELLPGRTVEEKLDACKVLYSIGTLL